MIYARKRVEKRDGRLDDEDKGWRYNGGGGALPQGMSQLYEYIMFIGICIREHTYTTYIHTRTHADYDAAPGCNYGNSVIYIYYIYTFESIYGPGG